MVICLRQLWLLTHKNLIITRRCKKWTLFELVIPLAVLLPLITTVVQNRNIELVTARSFDAVPLKGDSSDITRKVGFVLPIQAYWCHHEKVHLAYYAYDGFSTAEVLMKNLTSRYTNVKTSLVVERINSEEEMLELLRNDALNGTAGCIVNRYAGGVIFNRLNTDQEILEYRIVLPMGIKEDYWHLDQEWDDPFVLHLDYDSIPAAPPYWSTAFLSLQYTIDSLFIDATTGSNVIAEEVNLRRMPEPSHILNTVAKFLKVSSFIWGLSAFVLMVHTARELASERSTVKELLSVMGLSTPLFYLSHIFYSSVKCLIVFYICSLPLISAIWPISISLFFVIITLYGISTVVFAALVSSLFKTPNTVLKVAVICWVILVGVSFYAPRDDQIFLCGLFCLNPNAALFYSLKSMGDYMERDRVLSFSNMFEGGSFSFTVGTACLLLLFDICWMFSATLFFDSFFSDSDFTFFKTNILKRDLQSSSSPLGIVNDYNETDEGLLQTKAGIRVQQLIKVWSSTGERAIDEMALEAYVGQVTVLLGHNGAGKSTTFSVISGITAPTSGTVFINDFDIQKQKSSCRKYIGLCPQGNALFDQLSVKEHLWLMHGLKGAAGSYEVESQQLLSQLKLDEKSDELSKNLSGGQRRKLCVLMAVIGGSEVILLDEPTAGMDPGARRDVESLIQSIKMDRTILLTTHYMDEAELLGDRVAIMNKGRVYCCGTPQFLKKKFGTGYIMTVVVADSTDVQKIAMKVEKIATSYVKEATKGNVHGKQFEVILPKEHQESFPALFEHLEKAKDQLKISGFGLSLNTLEQVFLKVAEKADPSPTDSIDASSSICAEFIEAQHVDRLSGYSLISAQILAIFIKKVLYCFRNWPQLLFQVVIPVGILLLVAYGSGLTLNMNEDRERRYSLETFGPSRIPVKIIKESPVSKAYISLSRAGPDAIVTELNENDNLTLWMEQLPKHPPAAGLGAVFRKDASEVLFRIQAFHSLPTSLNLLSNSRLKAYAKNTNAVIRTSLYVYAPYMRINPDAPRIISAAIVSALLGPFLILALSVITSSFVMFLVEERVIKFAHQQSLTGISPIVFWATSFLYDLLFYSVICSCFLTIFLLAKWMEGYLLFLVLLLILYFWSCVPFVYAVSFMFTSPSKANVLLFLWQLLAAFAGMVILFVISTTRVVKPHVTEFLRSIFLFIFPSFAFGNAIMTIGISSVSKGVQPSLWQWNMLGKNITFMSIFGCLSTLLFVLFQFKAVRFRWYQIWDLRCGRKNYARIDTDEEDSAVLAERVHVQQCIDDFTLEVKDLCKVYGRLWALDRLTMGVRHGECFGLLGENGAGKTTTFDILTGQSFATSGRACIDKRDVTEQIPIGYCPQFDALLLDFTGKEILEILARMHGFPNPTELADFVLQSVGMLDNANKLVRYCSGGQRRKISIGVAILAPTPIIILDEPTAGIDPKARREIWEVLSMVRDHSQTSLLLSSHSMDECEALCSRIAVLHKGRMIAIGTSQQLKTKFGNSYTITMVAPKLEHRSNVIEGVQRAFPNALLKTPKEGLSLTLKWQIPKSKEDRWSSLFGKILSIAASLGVTDFCITQSSLEEAFHQMSLYNKEKVDETQNSSV